MGIKQTNNIIIKNKKVGMVSFVEPEEKPVYKDGELFPIFIPNIENLENSPFEKWKDYLSYAKKEDRTDFVIYTITKLRLVKGTFLNKISNRANSASTKSISPPSSNSENKYSVTLKNIPISYKNRKFKFDLWQTFNQYGMGSNLEEPTGRFRIDFKDSQGKLFGHSDMKKEPNGTLKWTVTPEPAYIKKMGVEKYFNYLNGLLNKVIESDS